MNFAFVEEGINFVKIESLDQNGTIIQDKLAHITEECHHSFKRSQLVENDILFSIAGALGRVTIVQKDILPANTNQALAILRLSNFNSSLPRYITYSLTSQQIFDQINKFKAGIAQQNLSLEQMRELRIPLPSFPEQQRIAAILDETFEAIAKAKENADKNLQNTRELFESYVERVLANQGEGWEVKKLGEVCKISDGTHFSPTNTQNGKYKYITAKNIKLYGIDLTNVTYVSEEDHKEIYSKCPVKKGDILYIKDGATAGIATLNTLDEEFSLLSSVAVMKPGEKFLNSFLAHYLNSNVGRSNFLGHIDGAAITRLTLIKLKNISVPIPPIAEQRLIAAKLDALSAETKKLESIYRKELADLEELKKSILQKAFEGELTNS